jgi:hypothetical protein
MIQKVQPGQRVRPRASDFNAFADAANSIQSQQFGQESASRPGGASTDIIYIKNTCGAARERFEILALGEPLFLPADAPDQFKNQVVFNGVTPVEGMRPGAFAVLLEPLADQAIGRAQVSGVTPALINCGNSTLPLTMVDMVPGAYVLAGRWPASPAFGPYGHGAEVLWRDPGTVDPVLAVVRLGKGGEWLKFVVVDGRTVSRNGYYCHYNNDLAQVPYGWYVDQIAFNSLTHTASSRNTITRDSAGNYIPTVLCLDAASFWPARANHQILISSSCGLSPSTAFAANTIYNNYSPTINTAERPCWARVAQTNNNGSYFACQFSVNGYVVPGPTFNVGMPFFGGGGSWYPTSTVGDIIPITPTGTETPVAYGVRWKDLTPRIQVRPGTYTTGKMVYTDLATGVMWTAP